MSRPSSCLGVDKRGNVTFAESVGHNGHTLRLCALNIATLDIIYKVYLLETITHLESCPTKVFHTTVDVLMIEIL